MTTPEHIDIDALVQLYDAFLLDSYGVLVDSDRALPGAAAFLERLEQQGKPWLVVSNDASRLTISAARRYRRLGLPIDEAHILTSGDLIAPHVTARGLQGGRAIVLGPEDSRELVRRAGMVVVDADDPAPDAVIVCDDDGYPFVATIEQVIGTVIARTEEGHPIDLVLPNPDLIYPRGPGRIGITAGSVALVIESALRLRFASRCPTFARLGKPHRPMFEAACERMALPNASRVVMLGDQIVTDIAGAHAFGIDSVLLGTGLSDPTSDLGEGPQPTWILQSLR
jgi:HAD superfamily hydrolase (TIGR01459 family)